MSHDKQPLPVPAGRAARVLVLVPEGRHSPAAEALVAGGYAVETVNRLSDVAGRLANMAPDALLLDLSMAEAEGADESEIRRTLAALTGFDAALREIERLRETVAFARAKAHDLAQPLTTILARSQLLMNAIKPEDPHYRAISIICAETERLAGTAGEFNRIKEMAAEPSVPKA